MHESFLFESQTKATGESIKQFVLFCDNVILRKVVSLK